MTANARPFATTSPRTRLLCMAVLCALSSGAQAWRLDYRLGLRGEASDNVPRAATDARDDQIIVPSAAFTLVEEGERYAVAAAGATQFRHYLGDSFDDEWRTELGLRAHWRIAPERLEWVAEEYAGEQPIDVFTVDRPDNLQRTQVFLTGPTLSARLSAATRLSGELRYVNANAERTREFNHDRVIAALRGLHRVNERVTVSGNLETQDVRFDRDGQDYRRYDAYGRYDAQGARTRWRVDLGYSDLDYARRDDRDGVLARIDGTWEWRDNASLGLSVARQFSDAAQDLIGAAPTVEAFAASTAVPALGTVTVSPDVFAEDRVELSLAREGRRDTLRLALFGRQQRFEAGDALDQDGRGVALDWSLRISPTEAVSVYAVEERRDFVNVGRDDRERGYGLRWRWQWLRNVALDAELGHGERRSTAAEQRYDENHVFFGLTYQRN